MNASGLVPLSVAANHLTGWGAFDWFFHILFAILGWIAVATPVYVMHRVETMRVIQPPPPRPSDDGAGWQYYVMAVHRTRRRDPGCHVRLDYGPPYRQCLLVFAWWMLPLLCGAAVTMYWVVEERRARRSGREPAGPWRLPLWSTRQSASSFWART